MSEALKPPHAVSIWASKEILYVELPKADGTPGTSHTLRLPLNVFGLTKCLDIIKARQENSKIGEKGDRTQFQADEEIKQMQRKAAGYTGKITRPPAKIKASPEMKTSVIEQIRRFINV